MTYKEEMLKVFKSENRPLTTEDLADLTGIDKNIIRATINKSMINQSIKWNGDWRNHHKLFELIDNKNQNNGLFKDLKKGYKTYQLFFAQLTNNIVKNERISLGEYVNLVNENKVREKTNELNKKLEAIK
jgi:hypothetical protein